MCGAHNGIEMTEPRFDYIDPSPAGVVMAIDFAVDGGAVPHPDGGVPTLSASRAGFVWVHLNLVDHRSSGWLAAQPELGETLVEALLDTSGYQRLTVERGLVAGVFADVAIEIGRDSHDLAQLGFIIGPDFLVTARRKPIQSVQRVKTALDHGEIAETALDLLLLIIDAELEGLDGAITSLATQVETIENRLLGDPISDERRGIVALRRRASRRIEQVYAMLALFRSATQRRRTPLPPAMLEAFTDVVHRLESIYQELQSIKEGARLLNEEIASNLTMETNRQLYVLSMLTAVFLPATLVTGFFGMNTLGFVAGLDTGTAAVIGIAASVLVYLWLTRMMRRK